MLEIAEYLLSAEIAEYECWKLRSIFRVDGDCGVFHEMMVRSVFRLDGNCGVFYELMMEIAGVSFQ